MLKASKSVYFIAKSLILSILILTSCNNANEGPRWSAAEGHILKDGKSEYFIGTNLWYAGRLATTAEGRERLNRELDCLKELGVTNLRVLAGEGEDPAGLLYALNLMEEKGMCAVLFLNNAWEWSYGYADYLERAGAGHQPRPAVEGYGEYMQKMSAFCLNEKAVELNQEYVRSVVSMFKDHPAIFSWQICNEPRCFSLTGESADAFVKYIHGTAALIKSIDSKHMVSTGNEGTKGCEESMELCQRINDCPDIDYMTIHIWPYNWSWVRENSVNDGIDGALEKVGEYIDAHLEVAYRLRKPMVIEEFGYPRDGFGFDRECSTEGRDRIYDYVFSRVVKSALEGGKLAGCNFWGWGGYARPAHVRWEEGDDLCGDPAQEQQGLNSVFVTDSSTIAIIRNSTDKLTKGFRLGYNYSNGCLFTGDDRREMLVEAYNPMGKQVTIYMDLVRDLSLMEEVKDTAVHRVVSVDQPYTKVGFLLDGVEPGFYQVNLSWECEGETGKYPTYNIGFDPESIQSPQDKKDDFDEFWSTTLAELSQVPMEIKKEFSPEHSDSLRNSYRVEIKSLSGAIMGGILCEPVKEGKYPVYLDYMGYGAPVYWYDPSAEPEAIEFLVSVRGQGIFREEEGRWIDRGLGSKEDFYYRGAFCDVVRAIDFVASLDKADTAHIFARGESQGGAFTFISAALDDRIAAAAPAVPFLGDYKHYSQIVWWPVWEVFEAADARNISREDLFDMLSYFDVKNFTDKISCPVFMAFGLQDPVCPPHTNFSEYNQVKSEKDYFCVPSCGHAMWQETSWSKARDEFFKKQLQK